MELSFWVSFLGCVRSRIAGKILYCTAVVVEAGPQTEAGPQKEGAGKGQLLVLSLALGGRVGDWGHFPSLFLLMPVGGAQDELLSPSWV